MADIIPDGRDADKLISDDYNLTIQKVTLELAIIINLQDRTYISSCLRIHIHSCVCRSFMRPATNIV
jgi:hypothetical protein